MQSANNRHKALFSCLLLVTLCAATWVLGRGLPPTLAALSRGGTLALQAGSWATQTSNTANDLTSVHFLNDNDGWAAGLNATFLRTTNGGALWAATCTTAGIGAGNGFNSVRFLDANLGFVGGIKAVRRITDGCSSGSSSTFADSDFRNRYFPTSTLMTWAVGVGPFQSNPQCRKHFRYTYNTSGNIVGIYTNNDCIVTSALLDLYFVDADNGWSVGVNGAIDRITNGSTGSPAISHQSSGTTQQLNGIFMLDLNTGWVVGNNGVILNTVNGGTNWTPQTSGVTAHLRDVHFTSATQGWAVGASGTILITTDGGATWTPESSPTTQELLSVFFTNVNTGYAVGTGGTIIKRSICPTITLTPAAGALSAGTQGTAYNQSFTASGGTPNYTFSVSAGSLPPGLSLSSGTLTGTPTTPGNYAFTIQATDAAGCTGVAAYTLTINCPTIMLSPTTLPNGTVNTLYNQTLTSSGGTAPYTCSLSAGTLPAGISLANCQLSGTPTALGTANFTIGVTDANNCSGTRPYSLTIQSANTAPNISAVALTRQQGSPASNSTIANVSDNEQAANTLSVTVNGGASATANGVTVSGLSINAAGVVTANVVAACGATNASFILRVTDSGNLFNEATPNVTVTTNTAPLMTYTGPQNVLVGGAFNVVPTIGPSDNGSISSLVVQSITPSGFTGTISVNSFGVVAISNAGSANSYTVTIRATDNCGATTDASFRLVVRTQVCSGIGFVQPVGSPIAVGNNPRSIAVADYNSDGHSDFAVVNRSSNSITILLGNGTGGFTQSATSPVGTGSVPRSVAVVDLNLDDKPDLAVTNSDDDNVTILLGNGGGGFTQPIGSPVAVGNSPNPILAGDFNLDGKPDLAVANGADNNVTILLGNGNGAFTQPFNSPISVGSAPFLMAVSDFNLDGKSDLAVANINSNNLTILLGNGSGGFTQPAGSPISVGNSPASVVAGDFNLDNKPDLAIANSGFNNVTILLGDGGGSFNQAVGSPVGVGTNPVSLAVSDVNLDGKADLIAANNLSNTVTVLLGNGSGSFTQPTGSPLSVGSNPRALAVGDFNLDGKPDFAVVNETSNNVMIQLNACTAIVPTLGNYPNATVTAGGTTSVTPTATPVNAASITAATSTNFKGTLTVSPTTGVVTVTNAHLAGLYSVTVTAFSSDGGTATKTFILAVNNPANCSSASFGFITTSSPVVGSGSERESLALGDFNGDGIQDLAKANSYGDNVAILLGNGSGGFTHAAGSPVSTGTLPYSVVVGDFNGDGKQDLAVANRFSSNVTILLGNGSGGFSPSTSSPVGVGSTPISMTIGDFNGDGKRDLAVVNLSEETITYQMVILLGDGSGGFTPAVGSPLNVGSRPFSVVAGDFNNDNKQDLAVANVSGSSVRILLGNGNGGFGLAPGSPVSVGSNPYFVAVGNFNGDGNQDLVTTNSESGTVSILLGDGSGGFFLASSPSVGAGPVSVAVGDFNGDGRQDLATANHDSNNLTILLGNGSGGFSPSAGSPFSVGAEPISLVVGDFNGDGKQDLVTARFSQPNSPPFPVTILLNNCVPIITVAPSITRQQGNPTANLTIGNVSDADQPFNTLAVKVNGNAATTVNGVTISGISVSAAGVVTADVVAACGATTANFTLRVTDTGGLFAEAPLTMTVTANSPPVLTYNAATVPVGGSTAVNPATGLSDNGSINSVALQSQGAYTGTISVNPTTGVVSIGNAAPVGIHTFTILATDNCGAVTDAPFTLTINNNLPTITAAAPLARQQGSADTVSILATVSDTETAAGSLTITATTVPAGLNVTGISNTNGTITASVAAACNASLGNNTIVLTVTDGNGGMATANLTVNVTANSAPVLTYGNQAVVVNGSLNINPASGPGDNGSVSSIVLQSQGAYTGAISVNNATGVIAIGNAMPVGTHTITTRVTDNCGAFTDVTFSLTVACPTISLSPATLPNGTAGVGYNQSLTASGGSAPYSFALNGGALPNGMGLSSGGVLSGTPTTFGSFIFTVKVTDANGCMGTQAYTLNINPPCPAITISPASAANGFVGMAYSQSFSQTGGSGAITWSSTGALPGGVTLNAASGLLSGTPTTTGNFNYVIRATNADGCFGERSYSVIINGTGLQFFALPNPVRLLDTRPGASPNACSQPNAPIAGGTAQNLLGRNFCGIPVNAQALTGNITTVNSGGGFLTLYPSGAARPTVASTNYGANEVVNNVFTVGLGAGDGAFNIFASNTTEVVVDVTGYYAPPATGGLYFHALPAPVRLLETRAGQPIGCIKPGAPLTGGADSLQTATTPCTGIPAAARSVVGNATTVGPEGVGFLTLYPADVGMAPLVASSNYNANQIVNGPFTVGLSASGQFKIFTFATTHLVVDVLGYYSTEALDANGAGLLFTPLPHPVRLLETRNNPNFPGCFKPNAPLNGGQVYTQAARGVCDGVTIPATALGVVGNATVVGPAGDGFLTLWPSSAAQPTVATANFNTGAVVNRHFIVGLGAADGAFKLFANVTTELITDLAGYFAP